MGSSGVDLYVIIGRIFSCLSFSFFLTNICCSKQNDFSLLREAQGLSAAQQSSDKILWPKALSPACTTSIVSILGVSSDLLFFAVNSVFFLNLNLKAWEGCAPMPELLVSASTSHVLKHDHRGARGSFAQGNYGQFVQSALLADDFLPRTGIHSRLSRLQLVLSLYCSGAMLLAALCRQ